MCIERGLLSYDVPINNNGKYWDMVSMRCILKRVSLGLNKPWDMMCCDIIMTVMCSAMQQEKLSTHKTSF